MEIKRNGSQQARNQQGDGEPVMRARRELLGGIAVNQEVIDQCTARKIKADTELIRPEDIKRTYDRVVNKEVRYRSAIDMTS